MDIYDQWLRYDDEKEQRLAERPICAECGEHIQDETAFYINDEWVCENCMDTYRRTVKDYV